MRDTDNVHAGRRAVSPVIGVVLMVAITVILAAVIGTFVLGLSEGREPGPRATFSTEGIDDGSTAHITIAHEGGDPIDPERTRVIFELVEDGGSGELGDRDTFEPATGEEVLTAGDVVEYDVQANSFDGDWDTWSEDVHELTDPEAGGVVQVTIVDVETGTVVYRSEVVIQG
jgi:flagellin-like protein